MPLAAFALSSHYKLNLFHHQFKIELIMAAIRTRRSFHELEREHFEQQSSGKQSELEILVHAFRKIQDLDPEDSNPSLLSLVIMGSHFEVLAGGMVIASGGVVSVCWLS